MRVVVATKNAGKLVELRQLLGGDASLTLLGVDQAGVALPDVEETGERYEDNALLKAREIAAHLRESGAASGSEASLVLADDSGLEVDALGGEPGVRSARYAGGAGPRANTEKLLRALEQVPSSQRGARFRCVIVVVSVRDPSRAVIVDGSCEGSIATAMRGDGGFGYDPVFELAPEELASIGRGPHERVTMAELGDGEKNRISHRGRAVRALRGRWPEVEALAR